MALELNLTKNTNDQLPGTLGKYYARVEYKGTIDVDKLAKHMHSHNAAWSRGLVKGLLTDMTDCIKELALQGYVIKIDDLGLFKATVEANGLTLQQGAKVTAGRGAQRKDSELQENIALQQFAIKNVKLLVQATGETTMDNMNDEAQTGFTSKAKELIKSLTGSEASAPSNGGTNAGGTGDNTGGSTGGNTGGDNNGGGGNGNGESGDAE